MSLISKYGSHKDPVVITREFHDLDAFAEAIKPLNVTANQLTRGNFMGSVNFADFRGLKFTDVNQNQALKVTGPKASDDLVFAIALQSSQTQVMSHGCPIKKRDIFGFDPVRETDVIAEKDSLIAIASVNLSVFQSLCDQMGYNLGQKFLKQNLIRLHQATLRSLRAYYQAISQIFISQPLLLTQSQMRSVIMEDFLPLLINTVGKSTQKNSYRIKTFRRYSLVKQAEEIALSFPDRPLTLQQLCNELGTSSSALSYGFQEIFGLSPMAYLKIQRLNGVRRALRNCDPNTTTVMQVAYQWGFWSAGHFSRNYKEMFGELPLQTLRTLHNS